MRISQPNQRNHDYHDDDDDDDVGDAYIPSDLNPERRCCIVDLVPRSTERVKRNRKDRKRNQSMLGGLCLRR